jgi:phosphate:Na+ symporter
MGYFVIILIFKIISAELKFLLYSIVDYRRKVKKLGISNIISLLSGVALFLFGMSLMGEGLKKVAGNSLEMVLFKLSNTAAKGVLLGTAVTAVIQSSSATSVMVVGFVNSGMMKVNQAIGIVLGAILGTSITGWIICLSDISGSGWVSLLSTSTLSGVIAVIGIILRMFTKTPTKQRVGDILLGFAVLMFGMQAMSGAVAPLRESAKFVDLITKFSNPLLGILVGAIFTSILQSASAAVGILQALAMTGAISFSVALPIIMGIAIGAAVPVLLSALGANINGKRTAFTYLIIDVIGVILWSVVFYSVNAFVHFPFMDMTMSTVSIALLNTIFRLVVVIVLTPCIGILEKLICAIFPDNAEEHVSEADIDRLEERFIDHPALAIEQSRIAVNSMARRAQENLEDAFGLLGYFSEDGLQRVRDLEDVVDRYEDKLGTYLIKITGKELTAKQTEDVSKFLHTISDFERISDHAQNIGEAAQEIYEKNVKFSKEAMHELEVVTAAVTEIVSLSFDSFINNDIEGAYKVEPLEELIDNLCDEMKMHHVDRLKSGKCTLNQGFVFNDLLTNYERVADHCSNIAVAMIELESDAFDTHEYLNSLKEMRSHRFDQYFEEYSKRFNI